MIDLRDFYIRSKVHPNFHSSNIIIEDAVSLIVQKIELCLFTNRGDLISDPNFGCDLPLYLWDTNVSADYIKDVINNQFKIYIPEVFETNFSLQVFITEGTLKDILVVQVSINEYDINAIIR